MDDDTKHIAAIRAEIGMVFQQFNLFPHLSVLDNVTLAPMKVRGWSRQDAEETAKRLLERVGIADQADKYPSQLSGGQQRRVAVARSLVQGPRLLLADECLGELDITTSEVVAEQLIHLAHEQGACVILVDHSPVRLKVLCDRVFELRQGTIREDEPDHLRLPMA